MPSQNPTNVGHTQPEKIFKIFSGVCGILVK